MPRRYARFGGGRTRQPVKQSDCVLKRMTHCRTCKGEMPKGDLVVRLRLKKSFQVPCSSCGHKPSKLKYFHHACVPPDINRAMGVDANAQAHTHTTPPAAGGAVPPPPKPQTVEEAQLSALLSFENALRRRVAKNPALIKQLESEFKKYQGLKAHVLRPGNDNEALSALKLAMKRAIDLAFQ